MCVNKTLTIAFFPFCSQQHQRAHPYLIYPFSPLSHALWTLQGNKLFYICTNKKTVNIFAVHFYSLPNCSLPSSYINKMIWIPKSWEPPLPLCRMPWEQPLRPMSPAGPSHPLKSWSPLEEKTCQSRWVSEQLSHSLLMVAFPTLQWKWKVKSKLKPTQH